MVSLIETALKQSSADLAKRPTTLGERLIREAREDLAKQGLAEPTSRGDAFTVDLSADGQKAVNLARGAALAEDLRNAETPDSLVAKLNAGIKELRHIGRLFAGVIHGLFGRGA